jgi:hypothetical protein
MNITKQKKTLPCQNNKNNKGVKLYRYNSVQLPTHVKHIGFVYIRDFLQSLQY